MGVASWHGSHAFLRPQGRGVGYNDHRKTKSGGRMPSKVGFLVVGAVLAVHGLLWAAEAPLAVSPGRADMGAVVESRCPTFSWGMVPGARSYELVVYQVTEEGEGDMKPVLRQSFPGSVLGWTPAMDQCLERGGQYAWSVQAAGKRGASEWSAPSLFEVAGGPSEAELEAALEIVQHYRRGAEASASTRASDLVSGEAPKTGSGSSGLQEVAAPARLASGGGDSALLVNGSAVVTTATFLTAQCAAQGVGLRFWDRGDGTVLDCNTGLIWLRDASCASLPGTDASGQAASWGFALLAAESLEDGTCGLSDGSQQGDWHVPELDEFCGLWDGSCASSGAVCCTASMGIVDGSYSVPAVANAHADGQWMEGDAFVGVLPMNTYWSSTPLDADEAWYMQTQFGQVDTNFKASGGWVWPVRPGQ